MTGLRRTLPLVVLLLSSAASAQVVPVGAGSYATDLPPGDQGPSNREGRPLEPLVTDDFVGAVPTNDWWSSLVFPFTGNAHSEPMYPHPLAFQAESSGLAIGYPGTPVATSTQYHMDVSAEFRVGIEGLETPETRVSKAGDFSVTAVWDDGARHLDATIGHGMPFAYFRATGGPARVEFTDAPTVWLRSANVTAITANGHHYALFAPEGATWTGSEVMTSDLGGKDYFSVAVLPDADPSTVEFFRRRAFAFPADTRVTFEYDAERAVLRTDFSVETDLQEVGADYLDETVLALYRHQWLHLDGTTTGMTYASPRGPMRVVEGLGFTTEIPFGGILPVLPEACSPGDDSAMYAEVDALYRSSVSLSSHDDTYWSGKDMGRIAELIQIANQVDHRLARDVFLARLRSRLSDWMSAGGQQFYYDETWGTLIGFPDGFGSSTELNDHHFHYGYHVIAAATLAQFDPAWADNYGAMVETVIADVANVDRNDQRFPYLRSFDPYAGHSWASGHAGFPDGNNQESSSESMNFAAGVARWGMVTGNDALRDLGIYLFATERTAVEQYWMDVDEAVFPTPYAHAAVGRVWGNKSDYTTFFGGAPEFIHGINILPVTAASLYLGRRPEHVLANYADLIATNGGEPDLWKGLFWQYLALADPEGAASRLEAEPGYTPERGTSRVQARHWIERMGELGQVDTTVTADSPGFAVFVRDGVRTRAAWNPGDDPVDVAFSDGETVSVPEGGLAVVCSAVTAVGERPEQPDAGFVLTAASPNPFAAGTRLTLSSEQSGTVRVDLFDATGRLVRPVHSGFMAGGSAVELRISGEGLPSGVYIVRAETPGGMRVRLLAKAQ